MKTWKIKIQKKIMPKRSQKWIRLRNKNVTNKEMQRRATMNKGSKLKARFFLLRMNRWQIKTQKKIMTKIRRNWIRLGNTRTAQKPMRMKLTMKK